MVTLRKILFYVFLGIYLVLCPLVVLYSLGYIYAPKTEEMIVKTGLIRLETLPSGATVFFNNKLSSEKTPCTLNGLLPQKYNVRIQLDRHQPWAKTVDVQPGKASIFDKILLLPKELRHNILISQPFEDLIPIPATRFLLLRSGERLGEVVIFDWKNGTSRRLVAENSPFGADEILRCFVVRGSTSVLFETGGEQERRYLWFRLHESDLKPKDLSDLFRRGKPDDIQWESGNPEYIFIFYKKGNLSRIDLDEMTVTEDFMEQLRGFGLRRGKVYGLKENALVLKSFGTGLHYEKVVERGHFFENIFHDEGSFRLDFLSGDTVFFIGENGKLISNLLPYRFLKEGLMGYTPDATFKKVLIWTQEDIGLFDIRKTDREETLFERGPEIDWFFKSGKEIKRAYFVYDNGYALFCDKDHVRLVETGARPSKIRDITQVRKGSVPFYSVKTGKLYFLEPKQGYFVALEIIPEARPLERMFEEIEKQEQRRSNEI